MQSAWFWELFIRALLVFDSKCCQAGTAKTIFLWMYPNIRIFSVNFVHPQFKWETVFIAQSFHVMSAFSLSTWPMKVRILSRSAPSRQVVMLNGMMQPWSVMVGFNLLSFNPVANLVEAVYCCWGCRTRAHQLLR